MSAVLVIPARWGSTRLPGKPLLAIAGHSLLARVVDVACRATVDFTDVHVLVATDDDRIADHARSLGVAVAMTSPAIATGSGRVLAALQSLESDVAHVVNLQGDAPFASPAAVAAVIATLRASEAPVVTPVIRLSWAALDDLRAFKRSTPFSGTTCIVDDSGRALWFSKAVLPAIRNEAARRAAEPLSPVHQHVGIYGYRRDALEWFERQPPSRYEQLEGLEQLRFLEAAMEIRTVAVAPSRFAPTGIDSPGDVTRAEAMIAAHGDPLQG